MKNKMFTFFRLVIIVGFLALLYVPLLDWGWGFNKTVINENRNLASMPNWDWNLQSISNYPDSFETFYNDNFGMRSFLVKNMAFIKLRFLKMSPRKDLFIVGKDGWMFYYPTIEQAMPRNLPYDFDYMEKTRKFLEDTWQKPLAKKGIEYVLIIAPDKKDVYREKIPTTHLKNGKWQTKTFIEHMKKYSSIPVIDLANRLQEYKEFGPLYYKTETHWNDLGALAASCIVAEELGTLLPSFQPQRIFSDYDYEFVQNTEGRNFVKWYGLSNKIKEENHVEVTLNTSSTIKNIDPEGVVPSTTKNSSRGIILMEQENKSLPSVVVFRDSFSIAMHPYLSEHFSRSLYYWQRHGDMEIFEREKPDLVIHEIVGREARIFSHFNDAHW